MIGTAFRSWLTDQLSAWDDSSSSSSGAETIEREVSLLLPQLVAGFEYSSDLVKESSDKSVSRI